MSTLRLSRYETNYYYYELHTPSGIARDADGYPICGDLETEYLPETIEALNPTLVVVGAPDRVNRISDMRTTGNAHPTQEEYTVLRFICDACAVEFNSTLG